jgi:acyl carrier protein
MKKLEFVKQLADFCEFGSQNLKPETPLKSIEGFDSLARMAMIAFVDENFNVKITAKQLQELYDFNSIIKVIGEKNFEND